MDKKKVFLLVLVLFALSAAVIADDWFADMGIPKGKELAVFYDQYAYFIDFIIYLVLFISLANAAFAEKMKDIQGKSLQAALGIAFSIGMLVFESSRGFNLGSLLPLAAMVLLIMVGSFVYFILHKFVGLNPPTAGGIVYLLVYFLSKAGVPEMYIWLHNNAGPISSIMTFAAWAAGFAVIYGLGSAGNLWGKGKDYYDSNWGSDSATNREFNDWQHEMDDERDNLRHGNDDVEDINHDLDEADKDADEAEKDVQVNINLSQGLLELLRQIAEELGKLEDVKFGELSGGEEAYKKIGLGLQKAISMLDEKILKIHEDKIDDIKKYLEKMLSGIDSLQIRIDKVKDARVKSILSNEVSNLKESIRKSEAVFQGATKMQNVILNTSDTIKGQLQTLIKENLSKNSTHKSAEEVTKITEFVSQVMAIEKALGGDIALIKQLDRDCRNTLAIIEKDLKEAEAKVSDDSEEMKEAKSQLNKIKAIGTPLINDMKDFDKFAVAFWDKEKAYGTLFDKLESNVKSLHDYMEAKHIPTANIGRVIQNKLEYYQFFAIGASNYQQLRTKTSKDKFEREVKAISKKLGFDREKGWLVDGMIKSIKDNKKKAGDIAVVQALSASTKASINERVSKIQANMTDNKEGMKPKCITTGYDMMFKITLCVWSMAYSAHFYNNWYPWAIKEAAGLDFKAHFKKKP